MLFVDVSQFELPFQNNLEDWCRGGPKHGGWSRSGGVIVLPFTPVLSRASREVISVDDALAKNFNEVKRWHIEFLRSGPEPQSTCYFREYLMPRYNIGDSVARMDQFLKLFNDIRSNGYNQKFPVFVADVTDLNLGFKYFRFDGCHRLSCCKVLGIETVPSYVFTLKPSLVAA